MIRLGRLSACTLGRGSPLARAESVQTAASHADSSLTKWGKTKQNDQKVEVPLPEFSMS